MNTQNNGYDLCTGHSLITDKLTDLRKNSTEPEKFRSLCKQITQLLIYEATSDLAMKLTTINTPLEEMQSGKLIDRIVLVPVLRAGLIMAEAASELLPDSTIAHLGFARDETTLKAKMYLSPNLPKNHSGIIFLLDPMLATGGTAIAACEVLKKSAAKQIVYVGILGSKLGVYRLRDKHPDVKIRLAAIDPVINEHGYIIPGLGDAGNRLFST